jgi:hypothetical protein
MVWRVEWIAKAGWRDGSNSAYLLMDGATSFRAEELPPLKVQRLSTTHFIANNQT